MDENQLYYYKMDNVERAKWNSLKSQIYEDCKNAGIPEGFMKSHVEPTVSEDSFEHRSGYCREEGFYYIYEEKAHLEKKYSGDETGMRFFLLKNIFQDFGMRCECENRKKLSYEWRYCDKIKYVLKPPAVKSVRAVPKTVRNKNYIYGVKYDSRKFWFEYTINSIEKILGPEYSQRLINEYTSYMNLWFDDEHWAFDRESGKFIEISQSKMKNKIPIRGA